MRKVLLTFATLLLITGVSYSQMSVYVYGTTTDIEGTSHMINLDSAVVNYHLEDFLVNNDSGSPQDWFIIREIINEPTNWSNYYCWGILGQVGECYQATADSIHISDTITIAPGGSGILSAYVTAPNAGCAHYRYHISNPSQIVGFFDLEICSTVSADELEPVIINVGPNPATDIIGISISAPSAEIELIDAHGKPVAYEIMGQHTNIDVSKFKEGVYFLRVQPEGQEMTTQKIIVQH